MMNLLSELTSFGAAGLMGAMWLWERRLSQTREQQLDEAHQRIERDEQRLALLTDVVDKNTAAIVRFLEQQKQHSQVLGQLREEFRYARRT